MVSQLKLTSGLKGRAWSWEVKVVMGEESCGTTVFEYMAEAVPVFREVGETKAHYSKLDQILWSQWEMAMRNGVLRYNLDGVTVRTIPGKYGFIAQRNPKRFSHRRMPANMQSLTQPFDPKLFNFNKVNPDEILFQVQRSSRSRSGHIIEDKRHHMIANVSPIDFGHALFVPEPESCLPQVFTEDSIRVCLELAALSGHSGFCMVSNSLLAYASVNHLHYHFLYLNHPTLASRVGGRALAGGCYELTGHPSRGVGFQLDSTPAECARDIFKVVSLLLELGVAHNLVMLRGEPFNQDKAAVGKAVVRTLLIPRKPALGFKKLYENADAIPPFFAASCELALGFIPVLDQSRYETLTEEEILEILHEKTLEKEEFWLLKERTKQVLECKTNT